MSGLQGRKVAILAAEGVDGGELDEPRRALEAAEVGAHAVIVSTEPEVIRPREGDAPVGEILVGVTVDHAHAADYVALVIPGGAESVRRLGATARAVQFVREFMATDKPVIAVAEGQRLVLAADAVAGRTLAAPTELQGEIRQCGGEIADGPVHFDERLITVASRKDLPGALTRLIQALGTSVDERRVDQLSEQSFPASDPPQF